MFAHLLALAGDRTPSAPLPAVSGISVVANPGFCNFDSVGEPATITLNFSVANPGTGYELRVLMDGALQATLALSATSWTSGAVGDVEFAGQSQTERSFTFAVQLVRTADGVIVQEQPASYTSTYGICR